MSFLDVSSMCLTGIMFGIRAIESMKRTEVPVATKHERQQSNIIRSFPTASCNSCWKLQDKGPCFSFERTWTQTLELGKDSRLRFPQKVSEARGIACAKMLSILVYAETLPMLLLLLLEYVNEVY